MSKFNTILQQLAKQLLKQTKQKDNDGLHATIEEIKRLQKLLAEGKLYKK